MNTRPSISLGSVQAHSLMLAAFGAGMGVMDQVEHRLSAALADILAHPGSLLRATIAYQVGMICGLSESVARDVGCGVEYMHTASLVLDDFPAMDDARTRRGAPCIHVTHGEGTAILASLALISRAYALLWKGVLVAPDDRRQRASNLIENSLGLSGLIGGQAMDLRGWREEHAVAEVMEVAARKTAALLRLPVVLPAMIAGVPEAELQLLDRVSFYRGLAYQAADDLKDVMSSQTNTGKTSGRDEVMGRPNLALAEGISGALRRFSRLQAIGDRFQHRLEQRNGCWKILDALRVAAPWPVSHEGGDRKAE